MRIQIINTNRERSPQTLIPLGACCVASAAESAGHEVHFTDLCFSHRPAADTASAVERIRPDVIGLSVRNLDNSDYMGTRGYLPELREVVDACRRSSGAEIVLGGAAVSQAPAQVARHLGCRLAVAGEGELCLPALLRSIEQGRDPCEIQGVVSADSSRDEDPRPTPIADLAALPDPCPARWLDLRRYAASDAAMPVQTKRGCAFKCTYCCYPLLEGHAWRLREPAWVAEQVTQAKAAGMKGVEFVDSVFGFPEDHALACCEAMTESRLPLTTLELNPSACSAELVDAMNAAGFSAVGVSAESGSDTMLDALGKGFTMDDLCRARDNLRRLHARKMWIFMLGGPGETEKTVRETIGFIESLPHSDLVMVTHGIRILPQTALRQALVDEGYIDRDDDLVEPRFYYSPHITPERAGRMLAESSFPKANMATLTDCSHPLAPMLQRIAAALGVQPPYWRSLPLINRVRRILRV